MKDVMQENWDTLRAAVVLQACQDYADMLKHPGKKIRVKHDTKRKKWVTDDETSLRHWFHSKIFRELWCGVDGEAILQQLRVNHETGRKFYSPFAVGGNNED